jgi:hypothetical protein
MQSKAVNGEIIVCFMLLQDLHDLGQDLILAAGLVKG